MSNTLAVAAVTTTIRYLLHESLGGTEPGAVDGAAVTTLHPRQLLRGARAARNRTGLNVYLYNVTWDPIQDGSGRSTNRARDARPEVGLDLHYLVTAYGDDAGLDTQRLLARAARALASVPVLTGPDVEAAIAEYGKGETAFLADSDLAEQAEPIRLMPTPLSLDELSTIWGALATPYLPSLAYTAGVVLL